jgi:hypothetical protein
VARNYKHISTLATLRGIRRVSFEGENFVIVHIEKEKWPVTYSRNEVSAIIPETPENLRKHIIQLKQRER